MKILKLNYQRSDKRGVLTEISRGKWKQVNYLVIYKDKEFGKHYHKHKEELFYVIRGEVNLMVIDKKGGQNINLKTGDCVMIEPFDEHSLCAVEDCEIIELLSELYNEKDIFTYEE